MRLMFGSGCSPPRYQAAVDAGAGLPAAWIGVIDRVVAGVGVAVAVGGVADRVQGVLLGPAAEGGAVVELTVLVEAGGGVEIAAGVPVGVGVGQVAVRPAHRGGDPVGVVAVGGLHGAAGVDQAEDRAEPVQVVVELPGVAALGDQGAGRVPFVIGAGRAGCFGGQAGDAVGVAGVP